MLTQAAAEGRNTHSWQRARAGHTARTARDPAPVPPRNCCPRPDGPAPTHMPRKLRPAAAHARRKALDVVELAALRGKGGAGGPGALGSARGEH